MYIASGSVHKFRYIELLFIWRKILEMVRCYVNNCVVAVTSLLPKIPSIYCLIQKEAVFKKAYLSSH